MIIQVDENQRIVSCVHSGFVEPADDKFEVDTNSIPRDVLRLLFVYKYIDNEFVKDEEQYAKKVDMVKTTKIINMSKTCKRVITNGVDWNGKHYSLTTEDQANITSTLSEASVNDSVLYHADNEEYELIDSREFENFAKYCQYFKMYQLVYFNQLKRYINTLDSIEDIVSIQYGDTLPSEYMDSLATLVQNSENYEYTLSPIPDTADYIGLIQDIDVDALAPTARAIFVTDEDETEPSDDSVELNLVEPNDTIDTDEHNSNEDSSNEQPTVIDEK